MPFVNLSGPITADKVIGKNIYAKINTPVYLSVDNVNTPLAVIPAGELIGLVYSYVTRYGNVYWQVQIAGGQMAYVFHSSDYVSLTKPVMSAPPANSPDNDTPANYSSSKNSLLVPGIIAATLLIGSYLYFSTKSQNATA